MKIKWLGHASFLLTSEKGTKVITDPYTTGGGLSYGEIKESADIVTVSHEHGDHNNAAAVGGKPVVVKGAVSQDIKGIKIKGFQVFHDESKGKERGTVTIFTYAIDKFRVCHLGDLGHLLGEQEARDIGPVDVLFIPVGGFYTIDAANASKVCDQLKPKVVIPMHFKTPKLAYPLAGVDEFLKGKKSVKKETGNEIEVKTLPAATEIWVLQPAL